MIPSPESGSGIVRWDSMADNNDLPRRLTIITPVHNEEDGLDRYAEDVSRKILARTDIDARVLFVDDGSSDQSWKKIVALTKTSERFSAIRLSRNYGAHIALAAGFDVVAGDTDAVATLACDLQDPPETVLEFVQEWRNGANIVWGKRRSRIDAGWRQQASQLLETVLRRYAMPRGSRFTTGSFLLMDRAVLECFRQFREQSRVTFALVAWTGFEQTVVSYDRAQRIHGKSGWTLGKMFNTACDVFIGFSPIPAKFISGIGFGMFAISIALILYLMIVWAFQNVLPGWTGMMATMIFFFGILFMMIGIMAEYLHRIFIESKNRPLYFISGQAKGPQEATERVSRDD